MLSSTSGPLNGWVRLWLVFSVCMCTCVAQSNKIEHDFILHTNVTLTFHHELTVVEGYLCNVIVDGSPHPFIINEQVIDDHLKPGQSGRFSVRHIVSHKNILTIVITINEIDNTDEGVYTLTVIEQTIGKVYQYTKSVYVTYHPGPARCKSIESQSTNGDWHTVFCNATVGRKHGEGSGYIMCYQHSKQAAFLRPVTSNGNFITAVYWMNPTLEIRCCSTYNSSDLDPESCHDFLYTPDQRDRPSSDSPDDSTNTSSSQRPPFPGEANMASDNIGNLPTAVVITLPAVIGSLAVLLIVAVVILVMKNRDLRSYVNEGYMEGVTQT